MKYQFKRDEDFYGVKAGEVFEVDEEMMKEYPSENNRTVWLNTVGKRFFKSCVSLDLLQEPYQITTNPFPVVKFKKLHPDAQLPTRAKPGDAGMDIVAVDDGVMDSDLKQIVYRTGLAVEIPEGYVGLLFPRSSIYKTSLTLSNSVGVIDSGYRGEIKAIFNADNTDVVLTLAGKIEEADRFKKRGILYNKSDRIVQLIVLPIPQITTEWVEELSTTERGEGGFGSTGK